VKALCNLSTKLPLSRNWFPPEQHGHSQPRNITRGSLGMKKDCLIQEVSYSFKSAANIIFSQVGFMICRKTSTVLKLGSSQEHRQ